MTSHRPYATIASHYLWQSRWYSVRQDRLRTPAGDELTYTVIEKPRSVWVVPVTAAGEVALIEQYRYAVDDWCLGVPAGNVEPGTDALSMAARELREEIGGSAGRLVPVTDFYTMNGIGNEIASVFAALGVRLAEPAPEPTELIRLHRMPMAEALRLARSGAIKDGPSALAILLSESVLRAYLEEVRA